MAESLERQDDVLRQQIEQVLHHWERTIDLQLEALHARLDVLEQSLQQARESAQGMDLS